MHSTNSSAKLRLIWYRPRDKNASCLERYFRVAGSILLAVHNKGLKAYMKKMSTSPFFSTEYAKL